MHYISKILSFRLVLKPSHTEVIDGIIVPMRGKVIEFHPDGKYTPKNKEEEEAIDKKIKMGLVTDIRKVTDEEIKRKQAMQKEIDDVRTKYKQVRGVKGSESKPYEKTEQEKVKQKKLKEEDIEEE